MAFKIKNWRSYIYIKKQKQIATISKCPELYFDNYYRFEIVYNNCVHGVWLLDENGKSSGTYRAFPVINNNFFLISKKRP